MSEHYRNNASAIPVTMAAWWAKSQHSEHFLPGEMCLCVMRNRHCPSIDSARGLTVALVLGRPSIVLMLAAKSSPTGEREGRLQSKTTTAVAVPPVGRVRERLSLKAKSRRDKLLEAYLEK